MVLSCLKGYPPELALKASNPISAPPPIKRKEAEVRMTSEQLHNIKHDVQYFKKASDLKSVNSSKDKRNQLHALDVKQFILDENGRKNYLMAQKKQTQSIGSDIGSMNHSNLVPLTGQSIGGP